MIKADLLNEPHRLLEIVTSLPWEPDYKVEDKLIDGRIARSRLIFDLYSSTVCPRFIFASTRSDPPAQVVQMTDKLRCLGVEVDQRIAEFNGWDVVYRMRSMPGI